MINKFQLSGKQDPIMQFVLGLALTLLADPNQIILIAQLNPDALKNAVEVYQQTLDMGQAAQAFQQALQLQVQAAKHGAKLNYLKSLKHQCAEDEELVYYKKGGSVDCGCKKKGGEISLSKEESPVSKFKAVRKALSGTIARLADATGSQGGFKKAADVKKKKQQPKNEQKEGWDKNGNYIVTKKGIKERERLLAANKTAEETTPPKINKGIGKNCNGSKLKLASGGVCPKCGKIHKAGIGCAVAKFKAYRLGGNI